MPRHGFLFTHGWCRHLFAQHPPLLQANVTQPIVQNAPAELLNNAELVTAGDLDMFTVWEKERAAKIKELYELLTLFFVFCISVKLNIYPRKKSWIIVYPHHSDIINYHLKVSHLDGSAV